MQRGTAAPGWPGTPRPSTPAAARGAAPAWRPGGGGAGRRAFDEGSRPPLPSRPSDLGPLLLPDRVVHAVRLAVPAIRLRCLPQVDGLQEVLVAALPVPH